MSLRHSITTYESWLKLKAVPGLGNVLFKRLIERFGTPDGVFSATPHDLKQVKGMGKRVIEGLQANHFDKEIRDELQRMTLKGLNLVTLADPEYPLLLKQIPDPPPFFSYIGTLQPETPAIAIVGSRQATSYGLNTAEFLGYSLAKQGFQVTSGMAVGIDTAAHEGALRAGGRTLAVLGSGLGNIYPRENRHLFHKIADKGAVISEFPLYARPEARHFPMRNRIIAGIATGTIVVEAAARSGSLITARLAAEYDREVFAVPGNIHSSNSAGTHALLKQGAKLVENHDDVMEELHHLVDFSLNSVSKDPDIEEECTVGSSKQTQQNKPLPLSPHDLPREKQLLSPSLSSVSTPAPNMPVDPQSHLASDFEPDSCQHGIMSLLTNASPLHIDTIIEKLKFETGTVTAALLDLELSGLIVQKAGKMFYITHA